MLDLDIFAVLVPSSLSAHKAFALPENGCLSVPNPVQHTAAEILKPLESEARDLSKELLRPGNLLLRFSDLFKDRLKNPGLGWVFGSDPSQCDVVLDDSERTWLGQGVSQRHFHVTIDQTHRILLHDGSQYGMSVGHQGDNEHLRRQGFTWILALEPGPQHWEKVTINVPSVRGIQFEIEFPHHRAQSNPKIKTEYTKRLHQFVKEYNERKKELPIQTLGLGNDLITGKPSQVETVGREPIMYRAKVGKGGFGTVLKVINLQTGEIHAIKTLNEEWRQTMGETYDLEIRNLKKELQMMQDNVHPNILRVFGFEETGTPHITMEYCPLGSLVDNRPDRNDVVAIVSILRQVLQGISYMHRRNCAHRDLKPANILVRSKNPLAIVIADFGLAKSFSSDMKSFCGTLQYMAPEMQTSQYNGPRVDVWSTGIMILYFLHWPHWSPLPRKVDEKVLKHYAKSMAPWVAELGRSDKILERFVAAMLNLDPKKRPDAEQCLQMGCEWGIFERSGEAYVNGAAFREPTPSAQSMVSFAVSSEDVSTVKPARQPTASESSGRGSPTRKPSKRQKTEVRESHVSTAPSVEKAARGSTAPAFPNQPIPRTE